MSDYSKYIKYKNKYIDLKKIQSSDQIQGGSPIYEQINENKYIGIKKLPYKENTYLKDKKIGYDNVFFIFEKLTTINYSFWDSFQKTQREDTQRSGVRDDKGHTVAFSDGITSFRISLDIFHSQQNTRGLHEPYLIWIAYTSRKDPRVIDHMDNLYNELEKCEEIKIGNFTHNSDFQHKHTDIRRKYSIEENDIEMAFTVFVNKISPISSHVGIFRNYKYFNSKFNPHINLAKELHGFAAHITTIIYRNILYMVTLPADIMQGIMRPLKGIVIGSDNDRMKRKKIISEYEHDLSLFEMDENGKNYENTDEFNLRSFYIL